MVKKDLHIEHGVIEIEVPDHFVGKDVELIIREKAEENDLHGLDEFFSRYNYDLSQIRFDRAELYE